MHTYRSSGILRLEMAKKTSDKHAVRVFPSAIATLSASIRTEIEEAALRANDRYLIDFIEQYSFCPFSREGREKKRSTRRVHFYEENSPAKILHDMAFFAKDESIEVVQLIFPLLEISPKEWIHFCHDLSALGHHTIGGVPIFAVAPLHPELPYTCDNPFSLLTLFRRAPDPTLQWVRLRTLDQIYEGRRHDTVVLNPEEIAKLLQADHIPTTDLYDKIAETNLAMAHRIGIKKTEAILREIHDSAYREYRTIIAARSEPSDGFASDRGARLATSCPRSTEGSPHEE